MIDPKESERLAPLVKIAYRIYRGEVALPSYSKPPKKNCAPISGCSVQSYAEGLGREIEEKYSLPAGTYDFLVSHVCDGSLAPFSEADCEAAVGLLNTLLVEGLFIQSHRGDCPEAVAELESAVPGLPKFLYADLIGWYGYQNR
jgi:hypothetical protein